MFLSHSHHSKLIRKRIHRCWSILSGGLVDVLRFWLPIVRRLDSPGPWRDLTLTLLRCKLTLRGKPRSKKLTSLRLNLKTWRRRAVDWVRSYVSAIISLSLTSGILSTFGMMLRRQSTSWRAFMARSGRFPLSVSCVGVCSPRLST